MVTVIIPTLNRTTLLKNTLKVLVKNTQFIHKILILNNSDKNIFFKHDLIQVINYGTKKSLLEIKNDAISSVKSEYILIMDDDLEFKESLISDLVYNYKKYNCGLCSGLVIENNKYKFPDYIFLIKYCMLSFYKVGSLNYKNLASLQPHKVDFLPGCLVFGRSLIFKRYKFDNNYILPFFNEDTDYTYRIGKKYSLFIFPEITCVHLRSKRGGNRKRVTTPYWYYAYGYNNSYFINKNFGFIFYLLYSIFRVRDHLHVLKQLNLLLYKSYIKGILYGYGKSKT